MTRPKLKLTAAMLAIGLMSFATGTMAQGRYPEVNQAEGALNNALGLLGNARDVFGGHKVAAGTMTPGVMDGSKASAIVSSFSPHRALVQSPATRR